MLHGVFFPEEGDPSPPLYTNRHLATPILSLSLLLMHSPLPSISLLISPLSSLHRIVTAVVHTFLLALEARVGTLSVANTNVLWWGSNLGSDASDEAQADATDNGGSDDRREGKDGRLLALCESGPPLEVRVPGLETVGWDRFKDKQTDSDLRDRRRGWGWKRWGLGRIQEVSVLVAACRAQADRLSRTGSPRTRVSIPSTGTWSFMPVKCSRRRTFGYP